MNYLKPKGTKRYLETGLGLRMQALRAGTGQIEFRMPGFGAAALLCTNFGPDRPGRAFLRRGTGRRRAGMTRREQRLPAA